MEMAVPQWAWAALSFLAGLVLGHWLNIGRDKRLELNAASAPIRAWVIWQLENPDMDFKRFPSIEELDAFSSRLGVLARFRFNRHWENMASNYQVLKEQTAHGYKIYERGASGLK